jgi:hypothetical protein
MLRRAAVLGAELLADALEVAHLAHDDFDALQHMLAGLGDALEALAVAGKDVDAQLFFQLDDGLGDARLRGVQGLGGFGQVEVAARGFLDEAELVQVHIQMRLKICRFIIMRGFARAQPRPYCAGGVQAMSAMSAVMRGSSPMAACT